MAVYIHSMKTYAATRISRRHLITLLVLPLIAIAGIASGAGVANNPQTGYILCVNKTTKAVNYPGTLTCPKGTAQLVLGAAGIDGINGVNGINGLGGLNGRDGLPGLPGLTGLTGSAGLTGPVGATGSNGKDGTDGENGADAIDSSQLIQILLPQLLNATYTIDCLGELSTGTGITVTLSASLRGKGYKGAIIARYDDVSNCEGAVIEVLQDGLSIVGYVATLDEDNGLALIVTKSAVNTLTPAEDEPVTGSFLMSITRGGIWPDATIGVGILNSINPGADEEIHTIMVSGKAMEPSAPVVNSLGQFVSIAQRKPGVMCRVILECDSNSSYLNWSN